MTIDVTLRFEDDEIGKIWVERMVTTVNHDSNPACYVINIQKVPDSYCTCPHRKGKAYTRGKVYGWYVCPQCNKVSERVYINWGLLGFGISLLPKALRPANRGPEANYSSPREWSDLVRPDT